MPVNNPNVGVAFALVTAAGMATALGASVVFFPSLVKLASRRVLASALGLSAGVMTYVSFVEIFAKSRDSFINHGESDSDANLHATLCFFGGVGIMLLLDVLVRMLSRDDHHHHDLPEDPHRHHDHPEDQQANRVTHACLACSDDPVGDLETLQRQAASIIVRNEHEAAEHTDSGEVSVQAEVPAEIEGADEEDAENVEEKKKAEEENKKLVKMGINTAIAIGLHNFPEGLATFVAALDNPRVGGVLAIAIGIHNIPEGLCVALPIYYATGNRMKAFGWALLSGASEPLAALLGWAILANSFSDQMYAILFGVVAGMMVVISTRELLPTAHRYDPEDTVVTFSFIVGMGVMAVSLVLFLI